MAQREKVSAAKSDNLSSSPRTHIVGVNQNLQSCPLSLTHTPPPHESNLKKANPQDQIVSSLSYITHLRSWEQFFKTLLKAEREAWDSVRTLKSIQTGKNVNYLCPHTAQYCTNPVSSQVGYHMLIPALRRLRLETVVSSRTSGSIDEILFQNNQPINQTQINK